MYTCAYYTKIIFFEIKKYEPKMENTLFVKIKKNNNKFSCNIEIIPYIDNFNSVTNNFFFFYFCHILIGLLIFLLGLVYFPFFNSKLKNSELSLFFIFCLLVSIYTLTISPLVFYLMNVFNIDFYLFERIKGITLAGQPLRGLFFCKNYSIKNQGY